jgi:3-hydroxyisobutyrate dehydrogenase
MAKVAFLGLGVMGYPMAGHLAKAGHDVTVYNRTTAKAEKWAAQHGGRVGKTPAEAVAGAESRVLLRRGRPDLEAVTLGPNGAFDAMAKGAVFVDHTTASASSRARWRRKREAGPGLRGRARVGRTGGRRERPADDHVRRQARGLREGQPVASVYAEDDPACSVRRGSGQLAKSVNQICIAGLVQGCPRASTSASAPAST